MEKETAFDYDRLHVTLSDDFRQYLAGLAKMSQHWVPKIRLQYAEKAYEMYQDPSVRKLVSAFLREDEKREKELADGFLRVAEYPDYPDDLKLNGLETSCLNHASEYAQAIFLLFDIDLSR